MKTKSKQYNKGYTVGITWDHSWNPGGPFVYEDRGHANTDSERLRRKLMAQDSKNAKQDWRDGFNTGIVERDNLKNKG
jgi:hypothetical protein